MSFAAILYLRSQPLGRAVWSTDAPPMDVGERWLLQGQVSLRAHAYVDHEAGEFSRDQRIRNKLRKVSTQSIDGVWGHLKTWYNGRYGAYPQHVWSVVKEWQWRHNHRGEDLFAVLLSDIGGGLYR